MSQTHHSDVVRMMYCQMSRYRDFNLNLIVSIHGASFLRPLMGKSTICISENKDVDMLCSNCISVFVFATRIVLSLFVLNSKFQASSLFL